MYYVCQIQNNILGEMTECSDEKEAKQLLVRIIRENGVKVNKAVRNEINNSLSFLGDNWSVCIGIVG